MPSWKIHLNLAEKIKIKYKNKDAFLLSNVAPDIENGWILKDVRQPVDSAVSHFYAQKCVGQQLPDLHAFLKHNLHTLFTDVGLGYYCHLLTDYYWNNFVNIKCYIYDTSGMIIGIHTLKGDVTGDKKFCTSLKQKDFQIFSNSLKLNERLVFENLSKTDIANFENFFHIPPADLQKAVCLINSLTPPPSPHEETLLFTVYDYNLLHDDCIRFVESEIYRLLNN